ncbi:MAG TPA: phenylacetate--CoA ligase family protein [Pirellulales bacterium]|jgi:phenylacetate-CoA ligase|nr:phenylacetate--CoA ligase family protein [Pirellulales bacterium]
MMVLTSPAERRRLESLEPAALEEYQLQRLNSLLDRILPANRFYAERLDGLARPLGSLERLAELPYTYKEGLIGSRKPGDVAAHLTYPLEQYVRYHQTSGTRGRPLVVLDTAEDWNWWVDCWQSIYDAADVTSSDCVMMAFSFGPFVGFWSAYDAAIARGCLAVPGGGMNTVARLELMRSCRAAVVCCTPSYALHMAEVGAQRQIDVGNLDVRVLILAGEPGGSIPAVRAQIEQAWQARVLDHGGATEVGPWGYGDREKRGLHVMESEFIAEFLSVETGGPAGEGELSELVLTTLGRAGCPAIRYRTGDLVRPVWQHGQANRFVLLEGGVIGRTDDMMIIRGVNVFPSAIEQILRSFPEVLEYRMTVHKVEAMDQLRVEIEDRLEQPRRVAEELRLRLGLKIDVQTVPLGSLPRFEGKAQRFVDRR